MWQRIFGHKDDEEEMGNDFVVVDFQGRALQHAVSRGKLANGRELAQELLAEAVESKASDLLIQPTSETKYDVRVRVHGGLRTVRSLESEDGRAVVNCVKAISGMDIAERRRPQDGRFTARMASDDVRFRVATAGVMQGEKVAIRILDPSIGSLSLASIGMLPSDMALVQSLVASQAGLILVCGPTGCGKSTTIQAMLRSIDGVDRNVVTIEEPIEYVLPNASQIEVNRKAGIAFAEILRSVLRQDPDVISIGEIRDAETATVALQAAQTGHIVFATLHSSGNVSAIQRLTDLGADSQLVADTVRLVISQRLLRRLCEHCKMREAFSDAERTDLWKKMVDPDRLFAPRGCEHCAHVGFSGRTAVFDVMAPDGDLRRRIVEQRFQTSSAQRMSPMQVRATQLAMVGWTSWEDVQRVGSSE